MDRFLDTTKYLIIIVFVFGLAPIITAQTPTPESVTSPIVQPSPSVQRSPSIQIIPTPISSQQTSPEEKAKPDQWAVNLSALITAVGSLYPMLIVLIVLIFIYLLRKEIRSLISRFSSDAHTVELAGFKLQAKDKSIEDEKKSEFLDEKIKSLNEEDTNSKNIVESEKNNPESEKINDLTEDLFDIYKRAENLEEFESVFNKFQLEEKDEARRLKNNRNYLFLRSIKGDETALEKLKKLAKIDEESCHAYYLVALIYQHNNNLEKVLEYCELSINHCKKEKDKVGANAVKAEILSKFGRKEEAYALLINALEETNDDEALVMLYRKLASLYKSDENLWLKTLALEKALEINPTNTDVLFDIAYTYGEIKEFHLSAYHYLKLLNLQPKNASVLNNLGVNYQNLEMPFHSISSYKKASALNSTLSSANLAYRLIEIGFSEEASKILNEAKEKEDFHPNVASAIANISQKQEEENEAAEKIRESALEHQQFFRNYAGKYFDTAKVDFNLNGVWHYEGNNEATISQTGNEFETFLYISHINYQIKGTINSLIISLGRYTKETSYFSKEVTYKFDKGGRAYISNDGNQIDLLISEESTTEFSRVIKLKRKELETVMENENLNSKQ
jgi:Tfp pilus assembly protein PilF